MANGEDLDQTPQKTASDQTFLMACQHKLNPDVPSDPKMTLTNSLDQDQMPPNAVSDLGLHCLLTGILNQIQYYKPEDHWSCIAHLSAESMYVKISDY